MYCKYCGTQIDKDSKFCTNCGKQTNEINNNININNNQNSMQKKDSNGTASIILGIISIFICALPLSIVGLILAIKTKDKSTKNAGIILNSIGLALSVLVIIALIFSFINSYDDINYDSYDNTTITTEKEDTKLVGDQEYGYVLVPTDWETTSDTNTRGTIQYTDPENKYIITIDIINQDVTDELAAKAITEGIKEDTESAYFVSDTCNQYKGYLINALYKDGKYLKAYIFKTSDNVLRLVSIEGPDENNAFFNIPNTYKLYQ